MLQEVSLFYLSHFVLGFTWLLLPSSYPNQCDCFPHHTSFQQDMKTSIFSAGVAGFPITIATLELGVGCIYALFMWAAPDARRIPKVRRLSAL
jgi:hypothetical protein